MLRRLLFLFAFLSMGGIGYAGTISFDQLAVSDDLSAVKYNGDLNRVYQKVNSNIQTDNIADDTVAEVDMADDANPRIRTAEGAWCDDFVYTGLLPTTTSGTLTGSIPAGTAYPDGYRVVKSGATAKTYTASKWTWVDLDVNGNFQYTETAWGAATPAVAANSTRLARVSSDSAQVNSVLDMRNTSCTDGPFSQFADSTAEATLSDIFTNGNGGIQFGLNLISNDSTKVYIKPGSAYINGEYRTLSSQLAVPINSNGAPSAGTSGLDTGSVAASTTYYMYATADVDATKPVVGIFSTNASTPSGATNYRKIGEVTTDAGSGFTITSADITSVNYVGKIRQIKKYATGAVATGTTAMVNDDTPPTNTEGDQYMQLSFTPVSASNRLRIDAVVLGAGTAATNFAALYQDATVNALSACKMAGSAGDGNIMVWTTDILAGTTAKTTFKVRAGVAAGTFTFNGAGGARLFGGVYASSIQITEYEP